MNYSSLRFFIVLVKWIAVWTPITGISQVLQKTILSAGTSPSVFADQYAVQLVFASGDSILYSQSVDHGKTFSIPLLVGYLPKLSIGGGRGPQIVSGKGRLLIAAVDQTGDIYTFSKSLNTGNWVKGKTINDIPGIAKEGFISLASNNKGTVYAVWLDLRDNSNNKVAGASSVDGGLSWSKNTIVYTSPDGTVCECCKPSVKMNDQLVIVMFRNWLKGNRDLYLIRSSDGGINYDQVQKLGNKSWKLNACPMDGGGFLINQDHTVYSLWRRQDDIYSCESGQEEIWVAKGKQCAVAGKSNNYFIAYVNEGQIYCRKPGGKTVNLGKGSYPQLISFADQSAVCAWGADGKIYTTVIN